MRMVGEVGLPNYFFLLSSSFRTGDGLGFIRFCSWDSLRGEPRAGLGGGLGGLNGGHGGSGSGLGGGQGGGCPSPLPWGVPIPPS